MLEVGWSEILVIALILIIVVGPKDLPGMLRNFGRMATRVRSMANDFKGQFDQAMREAELDDVQKTVGDLRKYNPASTLRDAINPIRQFGQDIKSDLNKASDFSTKPVADEGTKVSELASDPALDPEPASTAQTADGALTPDAVPTLPQTAPDVASIASGGPAVKPTPSVTPPPITAASAPVSPATIADATVPDARPKRSSRKPAAVSTSADSFPPPATKTVKRKATEKHVDHKIHVVETGDAAVAPRKPATRKKNASTGDA